MHAHGSLDRASSARCDGGTRGSHDDATVLVVWAVGYKDYWCLITNDPTAQSGDYAVRYWQEAGRYARLTPSWSIVTGGWLLEQRFAP